MTEEKRTISQEAQAEELANQLWSIADDLRGNMDASKFKDYILGIIFYRYLSEHTEAYMNELLKEDDIQYEEAYNDPKYTDVVKKWSSDYLGYVMKPENMWKSLIAKIKDGTFSIQHLETAINEMTESTLGTKYESTFDKLFDDMDLQDKDLGKSVSDRTTLIAKVMEKVDDLTFGLEDAKFDVLGTAYMTLLGLFASDAGKKGGEFFTPVTASRLLARLATLGLTEARSVSDCCAGSGSLLLEVQNQLSEHRVGHFYAQEKNASTYNLLRMNLIMHGLSPEKFTVYNDDTIYHDNFGEEKFTVQVDNPPYSLKYGGEKSLLDDPRYSACGVLPAKSHADFAFLEHMIYHMDPEDGRIAVLLPHGVLFRNGAEKTIRKHIIKKLNYLDAVIGLAPNMFHGTSIPVCILVLKANRGENKNNILFIDASKEYKKGKKKNVLQQENIDKIVNTYAERKDVERFAHVATMEEIEENDYNLNIPRYVDTTEPEPEIDINEVLRKIQKVDEEAEKQKAVILKDFELLGVKMPESSKVAAGVEPSTEKREA